MIQRSLAFVLAVLLFPVCATAQVEATPLDPIEPDRPDFTEGTSVLAAGHTQLEGGVTRASSGDERLWTLGEVLVRIGIDSRWEVRLGLNSYDRHTPGGGEDRISGAEDPYLGTKIRLVENSGARGAQPAAVSLLLLSTVPAGTDALSAHAWQPQAKLAAGWDLTPRLSLSSNLNYAYLKDDGGRFHQFAASLSAGISLSERWGSFVEVFGYSREEAGGDPTGYFDTGLSYALTDDMALDARIGTGLQGPSPNLFAGVGAAIRW